MPQRKMKQFGTARTAISVFNLNAEKARNLLEYYEKALQQVKGDEKAERAVRKNLESLRLDYKEKFGKKVN